MARRRRQPRLVRAALTCALAGAAGPAGAADSLATPITAELQQELWPVRIGVEIVAFASLDDPDPMAEPVTLLPIREVTVPDGHRVSFSRAVWTSRGRRDFAVDVAAHQHPRGDVEIEWDLVIEDAPYQTVTVGDYLLHRLRFGPRPRLAPNRVRIARSDIITLHGEPHVETVELDGVPYEIRVFALNMRG